MSERDPYRFFRIEAAELSELLSRGARSLSQGDTDARVPELLRAAHTLKGAARVVKHRALAEGAHAVEELLSPLRDGAVAPSAGAADALLAACDVIAKLVSELAPPREAAPAAEPSAVERHDPDLRPIASDDDALDRFLDDVGEASAQIHSVQKSAAALDRMRHLAALLSSHIDRAALQDGPRTNILAKARSIAVELEELSENVERSVASGLDQTDRELMEVRASAEQLRLARCELVHEALARTAHDVARELGKRVVFEMKGGEVRIDAQALGRVRGALVQAVRNAVAHGVELPAERARAGKPDAGKVEVRVLRRGKLVVFRCSDDGRGVDLDALRSAAERSGALPRGESADRDALIGMLFKGGLTTARTVTETSGRGIGLDVVRDVALRLGGRVALDTSAGKGTTLELTIPMLLASMEVLLVQAAGTSVALPLEAVANVARLGESDLLVNGGQTSIICEDRAIPIVPLARALPLKQSVKLPGKTAFSAVVVRSSAGAAAFMVDRVLGIGSVVVRPLPELAPAHEHVLGASLDAAGAPQLVLDPEPLAAAARAGLEVAAEAAEGPRLPVLVVDDSLTTRMLERTILESAGYEVDVAASAEEALEKSARRRYGLFLVDVEMPGMNGFDFVEKTRDQEVPAILVSSRSSVEDLSRGREVGASAYMVKAEFDQRVLLDTIRGLVSA